MWNGAWPGFRTRVSPSIRLDFQACFAPLHVTEFYSHFEKPSLFSLPPENLSCVFSPISRLSFSQSFSLGGPIQKVETGERFTLREMKSRESETRGVADGWKNIRKKARDMKKVKRLPDHAGLDWLIGWFHFEVEQKTLALKERGSYIRMFRLVRFPVLIFFLELLQFLTPTQNITYAELQQNCVEWRNKNPGIHTSYSRAGISPPKSPHWHSHRALDI